MRLKHDAVYKRRCAFQARLEHTTVREPDLFLSSGALVLKPEEVKVSDVSVESHIESWLRISLTNATTIILRSECTFQQMAIVNEETIETYDFRFRRRTLNVCRSEEADGLGSKRTIEGLQLASQI